MRSGDCNAYKLYTRRILQQTNWPQVSGQSVCGVCECSVCSSVGTVRFPRRVSLSADRESPRGGVCGDRSQGLPPPLSLSISSIQGQPDNNVFKSIKQNSSATKGDKEVVNQRKNEKPSAKEKGGEGIPKFNFFLNSNFFRFFASLGPEIDF
jgi:hypothetical protein